MISLIAVIGKNRELGKDNKLLWHIPGDLPRFKQITSGHPIIMGRKTFQSIGKPLPGRTNIVISSDMKLILEGCVVVPSIEEAILAAQSAPGNDEIFVIGGGKTYAQAIEKAERIYLTVVDATADADTFFPEYSHFTKVITNDFQEGGGYKYTYLTLER